MMPLVVSILLHMAAVSGELPAQMDPAAVTRIVWVPAGASDAPQNADCQLLPPRGWICNTLSSDDVGVVVIETATDVGFLARGQGSVAAAGVSTWGRLIRVADLSPVGHEG